MTRQERIAKLAEEVVDGAIVAAAEVIFYPEREGRVLYSPEETLQKVSWMAGLPRYIQCRRAAIERVGQKLANEIP